MQVKDDLKEFSHEKKAMSPLIATMLLIAFAVALGAMIMNWSSNLGEGTNSGPDCSSVTMIISPYLCYAENIIKISVKNTGKPIEAVTLKTVDSTGETLKSLSDSKLDTNAVLQREVPFVKSGQTYVGLIPSIKQKDQTVPCPNPAIEMSDIPAC